MRKYTYIFVSHIYNYVYMYLYICMFINILCIYILAHNFQGYLLHKVSANSIICIQGVAEVCTYICLYTYICIHLYKYIYVYIYTYTYIYIHIYKYKKKLLYT